MARVTARAYIEIMRRYSLLVPLLSALLSAPLSGCLHHATHATVDGAVLGRVVIYRNGVAFYERRATVVDGQLAIHVPRDRVDDFLKSLTVVDPATHKPLSVSIPRKEADDGNYLTMLLETPEHRRTDVLLTYVTEAPAWKPSYRVVVGDRGKVMLEGWAIVDNVSGEDWKGVLVGVGASSAMSFRYDLWSVRRIDRDLLQGEDKFAVAPPTGISPYTQGTGDGEELAQLDASEVRASGTAPKENTYVVDGVNTTSVALGSPARVGAGAIQGTIADKRSNQPLAGVTIVASGPGQGQVTAISDDHGAYRLDGLARGTYALTFYYGDSTVQRGNITVQDGRIASVSQKLDESRNGGEVIAIQGSTPTIDPTSSSAAIRVDQDTIKNLPIQGRTFDSALGAAAGAQEDATSSFSGATSSSNSSAPPPPPPIQQGDAKLARIAQRSRGRRSTIVIESHGVSLLDARQRGEATRQQADRRRCACKAHQDRGGRRRHEPAPARGRAGRTAGGHGATGRPRPRRTARHAGRRESLHGGPADGCPGRELGDGGDGPRRDRRRRRLPVRPDLGARRQAVRVQGGEADEPDRRHARARPGHGVRRRPVHRRGHHRARATAARAWSCRSPPIARSSSRRPGPTRIGSRS